MIKQILGMMMILLLVVTAVSCTSPPTGNNSYTSPSQGGQPLPASCIQTGFGTDAGANATKAVRCAQDTAATQNAIIMATNNAMQATENARLAATTQAETEASATAVAATSTSESVEIRITEQAIAFANGNATATMSIQQTRNTEESTRTAANATAEWNNIRLQQDAIQKELATQERNATFVNTAKYASLATLILVIIGGGAFFAYWMLSNRKPQVVKDENDRIVQIFLPDGNGGVRALARNQLLLPQQDEVLSLPAPEESQPPTGRTPNWKAFIQHRDPFNIPIGTDFHTGEPLFIDRRRNPHVLFAGTSGAGKTSGMIPFMIAMWGTNAHIIVGNGKGADYNAIQDEDNFTLLSCSNTADLIRPLAHLLDALEQEYQRREQVLARYNVPNWNALPPHAGEFGEIVIVLDEFLAIIEKATELAEMARMERNLEEANNMKVIVSQLWFRLSSLVAQARKTGIFLVVALTDVTNDAVGKQAAKLKRQTVRIVYRMNSAPSSRSLLDVERGSNYANGTVGFPTGQFLINMEGRVRHGVSFHPNEQDIENFLISRQVKPSPLPELVMNAIQTESGVWATETAVRRNGSSSGYIAPPQIQIRSSEAELNGRQLETVITQCRSLNAAGSYLDTSTEGRPSGQFLQDTLKPALLWRRDHLHCQDALRLLSRYK